jgi:hypothetical protein
MMIAYLALRREMTPESGQRTQRVQQARAATDALEAERARWREQQGVSHGR